MRTQEGHFVGRIFELVLDLEQCLYMQQEVFKRVCVCVCANVIAVQKNSTPPALGETNNSESCYPLRVQLDRTNGWWWSDGRVDV